MHPVCNSFRIAILIFPLNLTSLDAIWYDHSYAIAQQQMQYYGPIVSFALATQAQAEQFLQACQLVIEATIFGGVHTTAERRARWAGDIVPEGFIRLSVGCEDSEDLLADLQQALTGMTQ